MGSSASVSRKFLRLRSAREQIVFERTWMRNCGNALERGYVLWRVDGRRRNRSLLRFKMSLRTSAFVVCLSSTSCDPGVGVYFSLPSSVPPGGTESEVRETLAIAEALAERFGLSPIPIDGTQIAAYSTTVDSDGDGRASQELTLLVSQNRRGTIFMSVSEAITSTWSLKGDSLRQELRDAVHARFPSQVEEH